VDKPEAFEYRLGNRSALEWVIDQYQVTEDSHSGIRSDPNHPDDPEYIVRLVGAGDSQGLGNCQSCEIIARPLIVVLKRCGNGFSNPRRGDLTKPGPTAHKR